MRTLAQIKEKLLLGKFEFSHHAFKRAVERNVSEKEIIEAAEDAEIIEYYPEDKYTPSCLLLGFCKNGRPLHMQVSLAETELVKIITIYEPDKNEWIDFKKRR
ncbi:MAG: DUF4258 domain-containing protein [Bacteroidetes bacterium]|nr:MAG: DUF4258 domain-containing protein [Bacteroidota bacterium]